MSARERGRERKREKEGQRGRTRHPAEGRGEDDMEDGEGERERKKDRQIDGVREKERSYERVQAVARFALCVCDVACSESVETREKRVARAYASPM